jgi:LCP family protein required for cell wall assembly
MSNPAPHRRLGRFVRVIVALSATMSLLVAAGGAFALARYQAAKNQSTTPFQDGGDVGGPCVRDVCNYLLLGSDSRTGLSPAQLAQFGTNAQAGPGTGKNADTIMVVHTDPSLKKAIILSFPRDLWVTIPGHGQGKINSSFIGGARLVAQTITKLTDLKINHYLYVNLAGFEGVVDTLNGVQMCVPAEDVNTPDGRIVDPLTGLNVKPGCQTLDGLQALAFVRTRHLRCDSAAPDFFRIARQQQFLRAVLNRLLQPSELAQAPSLIGPILSNLTRDKELNPADLAFLVGQLRGISTGAAEFRAVPGYPDVVNGADVIRMDPSAKQIFTAIRQGKQIGTIGTTLLNTPPSPANIQVTVVDQASGAHAGDVEEILSTSGFDVASGVTTYQGFGSKVAGNVIAFSPGHSVEAEVVKQYLPSLQVKEVKNLPAHVAVFVSSTYRPTPIGTGSGTPPACVSAAG